MNVAHYAGNLNIKWIGESYIWVVLQINIQLHFIRADIIRALGLEL